MRVVRLLHQERIPHSTLGMAVPGLVQEQLRVRLLQAAARSRGKSHWHWQTRRN